MEKLLKQYRLGLYNEGNTGEKMLYADDHIVDENKTVVWNRNEVAKLNSEIDKFNKELAKNPNTGLKRFEEDSVEAIGQDYGLNKRQAYHVFRKAYEDGHSSGIHEVISYIYDYADFAQKIDALR